MKFVGKFLGRKANPEVRLRGFFGMTVVDGGEHPKVEAVLEKGPAGAAGLKVGDVITKVQDREVENVGDVVRLAGRQRGGITVKLTVKRGNETRDITFKTSEGI
jgi:S1-C subfamily serine protease